MYATFPIREPGLGRPLRGNAPVSMPRGQAGVASPYVLHVHPYPTRFHGTVTQRPQFGLPYVRNLTTNIMPDQFYEMAPDNASPLYGLGKSDCGCSGLGTDVDTESGVFRRPETEGGGIFNRALSGVETSPNATLNNVLVFTGAALLSAAAVYYATRGKR